MARPTCNNLRMLAACLFAMSFAVNPALSQSTNGSRVLAQYAQCGGQGGACATIPGAQCVDATFPGFSCAAGLQCRRQSNWYYQCLGTPAPSSNGTVTPPPANTTNTPPANTTTTPPATGSRVLAQYAQCGGQGGACATIPGAQCVDATFPGFSCAAGLQCRRQSNWYYQCLGTPAPSSNGTVTPPPANTTNTPPANTTTTPPATGSRVLAQYAQCGGQGGACATIPGAQCVDATFPGFSCAAGLQCRRQSNWYYQCLV